jgi:hypothetical protein|tara:strand:- start:575 stop:820 length:246 start_codon:yes stop_codon:yes gene_type:complete
METTESSSKIQGCQENQTSTMNTGPEEMDKNWVLKWFKLTSEKIKLDVNSVMLIFIKVNKQIKITREKDLLLNKILRIDMI